MAEPASNGEPIEFMSGAETLDLVSKHFDIVPLHETSQELSVVDLAPGIVGVIPEDKKDHLKVVEAADVLDDASMGAGIYLKLMGDLSVDGYERVMFVGADERGELMMKMWPKLSTSKPSFVSTSERGNIVALRSNGDNVRHLDFNDKTFGDFGRMDKVMIFLGTRARLKENDKTEKVQGVVRSSYDAIIVGK